MEGIVKHGTQRIKVGTIELTGRSNFPKIIEDTLINNGYDIDTEPQNDSFNMVPVVKINVYEVRR